MQFNHPPCTICNFCHLLTLLFVAVQQFLVSSTEFLVFSLLGWDGMPALPEEFLGKEDLLQVQVGYAWGALLYQAHSEMNKHPHTVPEALQL